MLVLFGLSIYFTEVVAGEEPEFLTGRKISLLRQMQNFLNCSQYCGRLAGWSDYGALSIKLRIMIAWLHGSFNVRRRQSNRYGVEYGIRSIESSVWPVFLSFQFSVRAKS